MKCLGFKIHKVHAKPSMFSTTAKINTEIDEFTIK